jgi:acetyltransferase
MKRPTTQWKAQLDPLFKPASIAVVGASDTGRGARVVDNLRLVGYPGRIYPVNPKHSSVKGLRCYPTILDIEDEIDNATIQVPASLVPSVIHQCVEKEVKAAVINSAGFAETRTPEGSSLQTQLIHSAEQGQIAVCGPNCQGLFSISNRAPLYFVDLKSIVKDPVAGSAAIISQSGSMLTTVFRAGTSYGLTFSHLISSGNEAVLDVSNYLEYLVHDSHTRVIGLVLEGIRDPHNIRRVAVEAAECGKVIVVLKVGRSEKGKESVLAHTSALAGSDDVQDVFFKQYGWVRVHDLDQLLTTLAAFHSGRVPKGRRLAVVGFSGGTTSLAADLCEEMKLELPALPEQTAAALNAELRGFLSAKNPLDLGGPNPRWAESVQQCISLLGVSGQFDMAVLVSARGEETYVPVLEAAAKTAYEKGLSFAHVLSVSAPIAESLKNKARETNVPLLQDIRRGFQSIRHLVDYGEMKNRARLREVTTERRSTPLKATETFTGKRVLGERAAKELLLSYGVQVTKERLALDLQDAVRMAAEIGYPVAVKIDSPDISTKPRLAAFIWACATPVNSSPPTTKSQKALPGTLRRQR